MKDLELYKSIKRIMGGTKIVVAGLAGAGTLLVSGCQKDNNEVVAEPEEIVSEVTEPEIEIIETADPIEEEVKIDPNAPKKIDVEQEDGKLYVPEVYGEEAIYAKLGEIEVYCKEKYNDPNMYISTDDLSYDAFRDNMVALFLQINYDSMDKATFDKVYDEYLVNFLSDDYRFADSTLVDYANGAIQYYPVLAMDPVYQNEYEIYNYYDSLYWNKYLNEDIQDSSIGDITSHVLDNSEKRFPLSFKTDSSDISYGSSIAIGLLMSNNVAEVDGSVINPNDFDYYAIKSNYEDKIMEEHSVLTGSHTDWSSYESSYKEMTK